MNILFAYNFSIPCLLISLFIDFPITPELARQNQRFGTGEANFYTPVEKLLIKFIKSLDLSTKVPVKKLLLSIFLKILR